MKRPTFLQILSVLAAGYGALSLLGALIVRDIPYNLIATSCASGIFLVVGAVLLFKERFASVICFWISASIYFFSMGWPAFNQYGMAAFSILMNAFYWSLAARVLLPVAAHLLLAQRRTVTANMLLDPGASRRST
jgi:hypothetical protein